MTTSLNFAAWKPVSLQHNGLSPAAVFELCRKQVALAKKPRGGRERTGRKGEGERSCQHNSHHRETGRREREQECVADECQRRKNEEEMSPTAITLTDRLQLLNFYAKKIREKGSKGRERKSRREGEKETESRREKRPYSCLVLWMPLDRTDISKRHQREQRAGRGRGGDRTFT